MVRHKNIFKGFVLFVAVLIVATTLSFGVFASNDSVGFTVKPIFPENQVLSGTGYFDLLVKPDSKQDIQVLVTNNSNEEKVVNVEAISASTTRLGYVDYTTAGVKDTTLKHAFADLATAKESQVKIPANSAQAVSLNLQIPKEKFDGIILGGFKVTDITERLKREKNTDIEQDDNLGMVIYNEYEYVVAVVLHENDTIVAPNYELGEIYSDTVNGRASIVVELRNTEARLIKELKYSGTITPKGSNEPMFSVENAEVSFAPNSVMSYTYSDELGVGIKPGDYIYKGSITEKDQVWEFSKEFTIKAEAAKEMNNESINQQQNIVKTGIPFWVILLLTLLLIIIVLLIVILKSKKTSKK